MNMAVDLFFNSCILRCFTSYFLANGKSPSCDLDLQILFVKLSSLSCMKAEQEQACEESGMFELRNCVITKFEFVSREL